MHEYIEKETAIRALLNDSPEQVGYSREDATDCIRYMDAADVAPVRHGEWTLGHVDPGYFTPGGNRPWICSKCKQVVSWSLARPEYNYCHNCGAKMDGVDFDG